MWTTGATFMIARITSSTVYANHNLAAFFNVDRSVSTSTTDSPNLISKMRNLRARNPYALFLKDNYSEISAKYPDLKLVDISKKVAEVWKSLPEEKKQTYAKKSQDQKANYEQEKKRLSPNDLQTIDADEKARRIELKIKRNIQQLPTKRPRSAYAHFLSTLDRGEADIGGFMKGAAQQWSQMTVQDKQKFEDLHQQEQEKYVKELVAWASSNKQEKKRTTRRSSSASAKTKDTPVKKTRGKSAMGKRTKSAVSKKKSSKAASDKEASSSSSSDEESTPKVKKSVKIADSKKS
jgi:hypothetical protein